MKRQPWVQSILATVIGAYMRVYHRMEVEMFPNVPARGPVLALATHFSFLDVPALIVADPFRPRTSLVVKDSVMRVPVIKGIIGAWGAVPVARDGKDLAALRDILGTLRSGRGMCIAAQGTRSRDGRLGAMHPVLMRLTHRVAGEGIPVIPVVQVGTHEAMPPGARFPRPTRIIVRIGDPIDLGHWAGRRLNDAELPDFAARIQSRMGELLPPERRPLPGTAVLSEGAALR